MCKKFCCIVTEYSNGFPRLPFVFVMGRRSYFLSAEAAEYLHRMAQSLDITGRVFVELYPQNSNLY